MTLHVCVLGIDGSGKSTIATALPNILAAELNLRVGSASEVFRIVEADEDHLGPGFHPNGLPITGHLSKWFKRQAKRFVDNRHLYPFFKLSQMLFQDDVACRLSRRYGADVLVSDGNILLSSIGRAANYIRPASEKADVSVQEPNATELKAVFEYLLEGKPLIKKTKAKLPHLGKARMVQRLAARLDLHAGWLPDVVIFLDLSPDIAMTRITLRGQKIDRHENEDDLAQASHMYQKTFDAFKLYRSSEVAHRLAVDNMTPGYTLQAVIELLKPHILAHQRQKVVQKTPLGTPTAELSRSVVWRKLLNYRYLVHYLIPNWFRGAWREPTFIFSGLGRLLLKEGYSAGVMRAIYDQDEKRYSFLDRIFLEYPLHRAVYDRLHILTGRVEAELEKRLQEGRQVNIFTAPSGFAYDLFPPLNAIANRMPKAMRRVRLVAADLDPHGYLEKELIAWAEHLGIRFQFLRGNITDDTMRAKFEEAAPYDVVLFVGLSGWLPKPGVIRHLKWIYQNIRSDGVLVSDCFTPKFYALSGRYVGYKASYYTPDLYRAVMDYCGFDGAVARVESGPDEINHVMLLQPRQPDGLIRTAIEATEFLTGVKG
jgi:thymidylate kinase/SAM-dependent methyltransferase